MLLTRHRPEILKNYTYTRTDFCFLSVDVRYNHIASLFSPCLFSSFSLFAVPLALDGTLYQTVISRPCLFLFSYILIYLPPVRKYIITSVSLFTFLTPFMRMRTVYIHVPDISQVECDAATFGLAGWPTSEGSGHNKACLSLRSCVNKSQELYMARGWRFWRKKKRRGISDFFMTDLLQFFYQLPLKLNKKTDLNRKKLNNENRTSISILNY